MPVTLTTISPETIGAGDEKLGKLTWEWGAHVSSSDPRAAKITGMFLDNDLGLVATTADRNWLALDLQHGTLDGMKAVGIAPMRGAPGRPAAVTSMLWWYLVSFPGQGVIERFAAKCELVAEGMPVLNIAGTPAVSAMTVAAATYVSLAGNDEEAVKSALVLPYDRQTVSLQKQDLPSLPGFHLTALSNLSRIVPFLLALWQPVQGRGARLQQIYVPVWSDVRGPDDKPQTVDVAAFSRTPTAMTSALDFGTRKIFLFLTFDTPEIGGFDIVELKHERTAGLVSLRDIECARLIHPLVCRVLLHTTWPMPRRAKIAP